MMGDPDRVVLDISSDEEVGFEESGGGGGGGGGESGDFDWISELLNEDGGKKDDSDDVVVVGEVILNPKRNLKSLAIANAKSVDEDDYDDDCVVLEEDPDKPVEVENDKGADDSDDLLVVSEKGQIACRDYPHPRHLCAKYPFGSTPHERHCDQCHCYVCDTLAPCAYWRTGISSVAHCHATDKEKFWKAQRQSTRKSDKPLPLAPTGPDTSVSVLPPVANQAPGFTRSLPNYYPPQNQTIRQVPIRPCSMPSSPGLPHRQQLTSLRDKFHNHVVSQQLRNASINVNPRDRRHNVGHMGPHFLTTRTAFKRAGSSGQAFATDRVGYNSPNSSSVPQLGRTHSSVRCGRVPVRSSNYLATSQSHRQAGLVGVSANYAPMVPAVSSQPNADILGANAVSSQHRLSRQPTLVGLSSNYAAMEPQMPSQGVLGANDVSFQPQLRRQPSLVGVSANYVPMEPGMPSQLSAGIHGANAASFQPQLLPRQSSLVGVSANCASMEPQIPSQPQVSGCANLASSQAPAYSLPYANSSSSQPLLSTIPSILREFETFISSESAVSSQSQAQMFSQVHADRNSANSLPQQTSVPFHSDGGNTSVNTTASQYPPACPANAGTTYGDSTTSVSQLSNQPDGRFQPDLCRQHITSLSDNQHVSQHGYQNEDALGPSFADFDFGWETNVSQTNSLDNVYNPKPAESPEVSRHSHLIGSTTGMDNQYDDWLVSGPLEEPVPTGFNILSPEAPSIDSGFLF